MPSVRSTAGLPVRTGSSVYPEEYRPRVAGRHKVALGDAVGLTQFGVNLTRLDPGAQSALRHWHEGEDEFVYIVDGEAVLVDDEGEHPIGAGEFAGFPAGRANGHHLVNRSTKPVVYIEIGTRAPGHDTVHYPDDRFGPLKR